MVCICFLIFSHSHIPVTGSLIGSQPIIFHSNREQMKCLCYMQCCCMVRIQEVLKPFLSVFVLDIWKCFFFIPSLSLIFPLALMLASPLRSYHCWLFSPSFSSSLHACCLVLCKLGWKWKINLWRCEDSLMYSLSLASVLISVNCCITILFNGST